MIQGETDLAITCELPLNITTYIFSLWTYKHIHNFPQGSLTSRHVQTGTDKLHQTEAV